MVTAKFTLPDTSHEMMMVSMVPNVRQEMVFTTLRLLFSVIIYKNKKAPLQFAEEPGTVTISLAV